MNILKQRFNQTLGNAQQKCQAQKSYQKKKFVCKHDKYFSLTKRKTSYAVSTYTK